MQNRKGRGIKKQFDQTGSEFLRKFSQDRTGQKCKTKKPFPLPLTTMGPHCIKEREKKMQNRRISQIAPAMPSNFLEFTPPSPPPKKNPQTLPKYVRPRGSHRTRQASCPHGKLLIAKSWNLFHTVTHCKFWPTSKRKHCMLLQRLVYILPWGTEPWYTFL